MTNFTIRNSKGNWTIPNVAEIRTLGDEPVSFDDDGNPYIWYCRGLDQIIVRKDIHTHHNGLTVTIRNTDGRVIA